jgi:hypothetical protein
MADSIVCKDISISLKNGESFENIVTQLQKYSQDVILAVKNGEYLCIYDNITKIPIKLIPEGSLNGDIYYYRSRITDDLYAFFGEYGKNINMRREERVEPKIELDSKDTIIKDGNIITSIHTIPHRAPITSKEIKYF